MTDWQACGLCGDVHPTDQPSVTLLLQYTKQNQHDGSLTPADAEALWLVAKCVHVQLCAANADVHNLQLELQRQHADAMAANARPAGAVADSGIPYAVRHSGIHYAVRKRNDECIESPSLDVAVKRLDNMQVQAEELGFDSSGASIIQREWATYTTDWTTVPDDEIEQARADDVCPDCGGSGGHGEEPCNTCAGNYSRNGAFTQPDPADAWDAKPMPPRQRDYIDEPPF
ncbi:MULTISPECIES: hypothetical protein [Nocardia]|uniref:hypothetical protein n=1 Tax=Nocardia TaxID=1817 RepID=UPI002454C787|nr:MULTISPECIES: hypothetical protein [Nocardia]